MQPGTANAALPHCRSWARAFGCYVLCTLVERVDSPRGPSRGDGGDVLDGNEEDGEAGSTSPGPGAEEHFAMYNAAVLVGRSGEVVGVYRKIFPTYGSYEVSLGTPARSRGGWRVAWVERRA